MEANKCVKCKKVYFGDVCPFCGCDKLASPDIFKDMFPDIKDFMGVKDEEV